MAANLKHINDPSDKGSIPSIAALRASQAAGSTGKGTQDENYGQQEACFNMGTGEGGPEDKPSFDRASNDENVAEYDGAGGILG